MKFLLIGGSGFIGQHFQKKLSRESFINFDLNEGINNNEFVKLDILDKSSFKNIKIDKNEKYSLIHLAAVHFDFQKKFYPTNVLGTKNILEFISENKNITSYVFFSSVATYGESENGKDEDSVQIPYNDYGKSKLEAEKLILKWKENVFHVNTIIIRPAVVYGEYNFGNVFNLIQQIKGGFFANIGSGNNIKSIAYVENIVDSVLFCIENINDSFFIYNYSDYPQKSVKKQVKSISSLFNGKRFITIPLWFTKIFTYPIDLIEKLIKIDLKFNSMRIKKITIPTYFIADKIRSIGFSQAVPFEESLLKTNKWIKNVDIIDLRKKWYSKAKKL